jgi:hypothetical protein
MADFADFVLKVAPVVSTRQEVEAVLNRLSRQQVAFAAEEEPLLPLIDAWLAGDGDAANIDREISTSSLRSELESLGNMNIRVSTPWEAKNQKSFGQYFKQREGTLTSLYGMTKRSAQGGYHLVTFRRSRAGDFGGNGDAAERPPEERELWPESEYEN